MPGTIDRARLAARMAVEVDQFEVAHPRSRGLLERSERSTLGRDTARRRPRAWTSRSSSCMHLHALDRGILLTPCHKMALMSLATTESDVDRHTAAFREAVRALGRG